MNNSIFNKNGLAITKKPRAKKSVPLTEHKLDPRLPDFIKLHSIFKHYPIEKAFHSEGISDFIIKIPGSSLSLVFSTTPFDIATMSMRGTPSCMRWGNQNSSSLVGSIIDPYVGLIYITDGKQVPLSCADWRFTGKAPQASKILSRAIVRMMVPVKCKKSSPNQISLGIERVYGMDRLSSIPGWYDAETSDYSSLDLFCAVFKEQFPRVLPLTRGNRKLYRLMMSEPIYELGYYDIKNYHLNNKGWFPYRDSRIRYGSVGVSPQMKKAITTRQFSVPSDDEMPLDENNDNDDYGDV